MNLPPLTGDFAEPRWVGTCEPQYLRALPLGLRQKEHYETVCKEKSKETRKAL